MIDSTQPRADGVDGVETGLEPDGEEAQPGAALGKAGRGAGLLAGSSIIAGGISALAVPLLVRAYPPAEWGTIIAFMAISQFLADAIDFGGSSSMIRKIAVGSVDGYRYVQRMVTALLVTGTLAVLFVGALLLPDAWVSPRWRVVLVIVLLTGCSRVVSYYVAGYWLGTQHYSRYSSVALVERIVTLATAVPLAHATHAIWAYPVGVLLGVVASTLAATPWHVLLARHTPRRRRRRLRHNYQEASGFGFFAVSTDVAAFDVSLVGLTAGPGVAGLYALASRSVLPLIALGNSASHALIPHVAESGEKPWQLDRKRLTLLLVALTVAVTPVVLTTGWWVPLIFGADYGPAAATMSVVVVSAVCTFITQPQVAVLQGLGRQRLVGVVVVIGVAVQLVGVSVLAPIFGPVGAGFGALACNVFILVSLGIALARIGPGGRPVQRLLRAAGRHVAS